MLAVCKPGYAIPAGECMPHASLLFWSVYTCLPGSRTRHSTYSPSQHQTGAHHGLHAVQTLRDSTGPVHCQARPRSGMLRIITARTC